MKGVDYYYLVVKLHKNRGTWHCRPVARTRSCCEFSHSSRILGLEEILEFFIWSHMLEYGTTEFLKPDDFRRLSILLKNQNFILMSIYLRSLLEIYMYIYLNILYVYKICISLLEVYKFRHNPYSAWNFLLFHVLTNTGYYLTFLIFAN